MSRKSSGSLLIVLLTAIALQAADEPESRVQITNTERIEFPAGGTLRLNNSVDELTVTGWDRPEVEITTIKSTRALYSAQKREKAAQDLAKIQIKTARQGNEVVITTEHPRPLIGHADFYLEYRINAPREARLAVDHKSGEVHVENLVSDIHIAVSRGAISLRLPEESQNAIDAQTSVGSILSDFPGQTQRRHDLVGYRFTGTPPAAPHNLYLRIGCGDITIVKIRKPPYALYNKPVPDAGQ
jgi:putative adhesin